MLLGTLAAGLLGNIITGEGILRAGNRNKEGRGILRAGYGYKKTFNSLSSLTNIEMQKHYQNEPIFNGVYYRDNLPKEIKDRAYVINLEEYAPDVGTHWIALYVFILTVLELNISQIKLKNSLEIKT